MLLVTDYNAKFIVNRNITDTLLFMIILAGTFV